MKEIKQIKIQDGNLAIAISGESEDFFCQDLYTKAVTSLIEEADTHGWAKHNNSCDFEETEEFSVSVLLAMTRAYIREIDNPALEEMSYRDIFLQMIDGLKTNTRFDAKIKLDEIFSEE